MQRDIQPFELGVLDTRNPDHHVTIRMMRLTTAS